jgi:hypothetical protein
MRGREKGEEAAEKVRMVNDDLSLGLENMLFILVFFFSRASLVEPGRFGSVQSVSDFENQNRTKPEIFCDFLIGFFSRFGFFGYFFSSFLSFLVFLLTPNQCLVVALISFLSFR